MYVGPITGPVNLAVDYELPAGQIGELVLSGWHVNTYQVRLLEHFVRSTCANNNSIMSV